jgi:hypothetical protein
VTQLARLLGLMTLVGYGLLAVTPCVSSAGGHEASAVAEVGARSHWVDRWCVGDDEVEPPPVVNVVCPCGCERRAGLTGPSSLDYGLRLELAELPGPGEQPPLAAPSASVPAPPAQPAAPPPRLAHS